MNKKTFKKITLLKLLPYETWVLKVPTSLEKVKSRLNAAVEPPRLWGFGRNHRPYMGQVTDTDFKIQRIISYRNSFLPKIQGKFKAVNGSTVIEIIFSLPLHIIIFFISWLMIWYGFNLMVLISGSMDLHITVIFWGLPILMCAIFLSAFWHEVRHSKRELTAIILEEQEN